MKSKVWRAFLPIPTLLKRDEAPPADVTWLVARGVEPDALTVLGLVRREVLPLVRYLESSSTWSKKKLTWSPHLKAFHFLVHDRSSGVPCPPEDQTAYVDLTLWFDSPIDLSKKLNPIGEIGRGETPWAHVHPRSDDTLARIAGVEDVFKTGGVAAAWTLLNEQSAWFLRLVESFRDDVDDLTALRHVRQFCHYFANMSQMRIS